MCCWFFLFFSSVCLFVGLYWFVQEGWLSPLSLLSVSSSLSLLAALSLYPILSFSTNSQHPPQWLKLSEALLYHGCLAFITYVYVLLGDLFGYAQPLLLFTLFLCGVSPILYTLTEAISTDTIWAMTVRFHTHTHTICMHPECVYMRHRRLMCMYMYVFHHL